MAADTSYYGGRKSLGGKSMHKKAEKFSFPLMKVQEIVECLAELNVHFEEADLAKARPAQVRHIYELLLTDCLDMSKEELYQPKFSGLDALQYAELHDDSVPVLHFVRGMDKLLKACGIDSGFSLRDLTKPDPRRVRRNLSAIINFHKFREERLAVFAQFTERGEQLAARKAALEEERGALLAEIEALEAAAAAEKPAVDAITAECAAREQEITTLNQTQAKIRAATNGVKEAIGGVKDELSSVQFDVLSLQEEVSAARGCLVASPDRVKGEVAAQEEAVATEKAALADAERAKREARGRLAVVQAASADVGTVTSALGDFRGELERAAEVSAAVASAQRGVDLAAGERAEQDAEREHLNTQVRRLGDKLSDFRTSHDMKVSASTKGKGALQGEYGDIMAEGDTAEAEHKAGEASKAALTAQLEGAKASHQAEMTTLLDNMRELQREVKGYHSRLFASLNTATGGSVKATAPSPTTQALQL